MFFFSLFCSAYNTMHKHKAMHNTIHTPHNTHSGMLVLTLIASLFVLSSCGKIPPAQHYSSFSVSFHPDDQYKKRVQRREIGGTFSLSYNKAQGGDKVDLLAKEDKANNKLNPKATLSFNDKHSWNEVSLTHGVSNKEIASKNNKLDNFAVVRLTSKYFVTKADENKKTVNLYEALTEEGVDPETSFFTLSVNGSDGKATIKGDAFKAMILFYAKAFPDHEAAKAAKDKAVLEKYYKDKAVLEKYYSDVFSNESNEKVKNDPLRDAFNYAFANFVKLLPRKKS
ncbi:MAG: hypothetical protein OXC44_01150 [Proteobacteria bacterium]|nr:hypothetical protein [Pseudomonadota bacterium]